VPGDRCAGRPLLGAALVVAGAVVLPMPPPCRCMCGSSLLVHSLHNFQHRCARHTRTLLQSRFGDVLDLLVTRHLHRVFICDADMRPAGVLSCTDILRLVAGPVD